MIQCYCTPPLGDERGQALHRPILQPVWKEEAMSESEFAGVTVVKAAKVYFDGAVTSRTVKFGDGTTKTLGIMLPGEYDFGTEAAEVMEILSGELEVKLPGAEAWRSVTGGESFDVIADSRFQLKVTAIEDYC